MNETAPLQKQDLDRVERVLREILIEIRKVTAPISKDRGDILIQSGAAQAEHDAP